MRPPLRTKWYEGLGFLPRPPVIASGRVFTVRRDGRTTAKIEESGAQVWVSRTLGTPRTTYGETLLRQTRVLEAVDAATGTRRFVIDVPGPMEMACQGDTGIGKTYDNGHLLFGLDLKSRRRSWEYRPPDGPDFDSPPRLSSSFGVTANLVTFGESRGSVVALAPKDGSAVWRSSVADLQWELIGRGMRPGEAMGAVVLYQDMVLLEVLGGHVAGLDLVTGKRRWVWTEGPELAECYLYGDIYYAHSGGGRIWAIEPKSGATERSFDLYRHMPSKARMSIGEICGPFLVSETHFFTGSTTGHIAAFDRADGRYVWSDRPRGSRGCTYYNGNYFMAVNGRLYYGDQSMGIHCWEESRAARVYSGTRTTRRSTARRGTARLERAATRKR
jgi:outer membrane protein assembly factor BamB